MKSIKTILLSVALACATGCSTTATVEVKDEQVKALGAGGKTFGIEGANNDSWGSSFFGLAGLAVAKMSNKDPDLSASIKEDDDLDNFTHSLLAIDRTLSESSRGNYRRISELKYQDAKAQNRVSFISENNVDYSVYVDLELRMVSGSFVKDLALVVDWKVFDKNGVEVATIKTVNSEPGDDVFPSTSDKKYRKLFIRLAQKNVEDFLSILKTGKPVNGEDSIMGM